jgi:hypothetical protein
MESDSPLAHSAPSACAFAWMRKCDHAARLQRERGVTGWWYPPVRRGFKALPWSVQNLCRTASPSRISVTAPNGVVTAANATGPPGRAAAPIWAKWRDSSSPVGDPGRGHCRRWHTYPKLYWVGGLTCRRLRSTSASRAGVSLGVTCPREQTQCPPAPAAGAAKSSGYGTALHRRNSNRREAKHE